MNIKEIPIVVEIESEKVKIINEDESKIKEWQFLTYKMIRNKYFGGNKGIHCKDESIFTINEVY